MSIILMSPNPQRVITWMIVIIYDGQGPSNISFMVRKGGSSNWNM